MKVDVTRRWKTAIITAMVHGGLRHPLLLFALSPIVSGPRPTPCVKTSTALSAIAIPQAIDAASTIRIQANYVNATSFPMPSSDPSAFPTTTTPTTRNVSESSCKFWDANVAELVHFQQKHGHLLVPRDEDLLFRFVKNVRQNYKYYMSHQPHPQQQTPKDSTTTSHKATLLASQQPYCSTTLTPDRIQQLTSIGFTWTPRSATWMAKYHELHHFWKRNGHIRLTTSSNTTDTGSMGDSDREQHKELSSWVTYQRVRYRNPPTQTASAPLSQDQIALLEAIPGFRWTPNDERWWEHYRQLQAFKTTYGYLGVKGREYHKLRLWKNSLRRHCKEYVQSVVLEGNVDDVHVSGLTPERIEALRVVGFCWLPPRSGPLLESPPADIFEGYQ